MAKQGYNSLLLARNNMSWSRLVESRTTDAHSLAVLLFHMLFIGHPLMGKKMLSIRSWDAVSQQVLFGKEPVFIFDPKDKSNEALDLAQDPTGESGGTAFYVISGPKRVCMMELIAATRRPSNFGCSTPEAARDRA